MPRRRAERQQEKEEFLQQNPELITFTTRIEVDADGGEDAVFSQDGGPFEEAGIDDFEGGNDSFILVDGIFGPTFEIRAFEDVPGPFLFQPNLISISENGFGVAGEDELFGGEDELMVEPMMLGEDEDEDPIPPGVDTVDEGEVFSVEVDNGEDFGGEDFGGEDDDEGGLSFGIDFTTSGRGSVVIELFDDDGPVPILTETFNIPFGTQPGTVLNFEVDTPDGELFQYADVSTNGTSISIVGVDLETNFPGDFFGTE
ncbi:MAG: hypothetical protein HRU30_04285 [Rhodobacteraceae bacterium]|nr:hypothetical protein [Paracoccaceae bacterium]